VSQPDRLADPVANVAEDEQRFLVALPRPLGVALVQPHRPSIESVAAMSTGLPLLRRNSRQGSSMRPASA
jgi:hypothetical protein